MRKLRGNGERMRKCHSLSISSFSVDFLILFPFPHYLSISSFSFYFLILCFFPHSLSISSFSLHFLFISSFSLLHFLAVGLQCCNDSRSPDDNNSDDDNFEDWDKKKSNPKSDSVWEKSGDPLILIGCPAMLKIN